MFIQTQETPNPATLKFLPGQEVLSKGTMTFSSMEEAKASPLAVRLFQIDGVSSLFYGSDFISITKTDASCWDVLKPIILDAIIDHLTHKQPILNDDEKKQSVDHAHSDEDDKIVSQIKELLDTRVRPAVAADGGDIVFHAFQDGIVYLEMHGACSGCPSSTVTLQMGIENLLKFYIPEVLEVRPVMNETYE